MTLTRGKENISKRALLNVTVLIIFVMWSISTRERAPQNIITYTLWNTTVTKNWSKHDPYWFSGHMFKGQGQTILMSLVCLLTSSLFQCQTWCRDCPQWVDNPFWFSRFIFKVQVQTTLLSPMCCPLNISFDPFTWSIPNLVQGLP